MNICTVGYGMMGAWHSHSLSGVDCALHTLVGRRPEQTEAFARRYGYTNWTTDLSQALSDPLIDAVILATPSENHAEEALTTIAAGKPVLVEIPIAMTLGDAERVVEAARRNRVTLAVCHPLRMRAEALSLRRRVLEGAEQIRQIVGRFYIHRLENIGGTGYRRSWTDNLLWHHLAHLVDFGVWLLNRPVRHTFSRLPLPDDVTGIPMDAVVVAETELDQSIVCTGSYYGRERIFDCLVITDRDSYRLDQFAATFTDSEGTAAILQEKDNCGLVARDFVDALAAARNPAITGESVLPAMRVLQSAQDRWDSQHGERSIPGRALRATMD